MKQTVVVMFPFHPPFQLKQLLPHALTLSAEQQEQEVADNTLNANVLQCNETERKVDDGVVEDWRCMPKFGAHILWDNDVDEARSTAIRPSARG